MLYLHCSSIIGFKAALKVNLKVGVENKWAPDNDADGVKENWTCGMEHKYGVGHSK